MYVGEGVGVCARDDEKLELTAVVIMSCCMLANGQGHGWCWIIFVPEA